MNSSVHTTATPTPTATDPAPLHGSQLTPAQRWISLAEFLIGTAIVIGHNVYHVVPNEVPILFVIGLISLARARRRLENNRSELARIMETNRPIRAGGSRDQTSARSIRDRSPDRPFLAARNRPQRLQRNHRPHHGRAALAFIVWTFAAFGEEISYRGYLVTRAADVGARSKFAYWVAVVLVSVLFGYGHYYKGPSGVVDSGMAGLVLGAAYLLSGRNLWVCILSHGFIDTAGIIALFFGWAN